MNKEKLLYAMVTYGCNLHCPHCFINDEKDNYDEEKFINAVNSFDGEVVIFGGEATTKLDRLTNLIKSNKGNIRSISTNLIVLNEELIEFYKTLDGVSTSWNLSRFHNDEVFNIWKSNCKRLYDEGINYTLMITLTPDLVDIDPNDFIVKMRDMINAGVQPKYVKLEQYIGDDTTPEHFEKVDNWLCELHELWYFDSQMVVSNGEWCFDCSNRYTLHPDGTLVKGCPQGLNVHVPDECFECELVDICRPCRLQRYCSRPKKYIELIKNLDQEGDNKYAGIC